MFENNVRINRFWGAAVRLLIVAMALTMLTYAVISSRTSAQAQDSGGASEPTPTVTAVPDNEPKGGDTVQVEVCYVDRDTGDESCIVELRSADTVIPPDHEARTTRGNTARACVDDPGTQTQICHEELSTLGLLGNMTLAGHASYVSQWFLVKASFLDLSDSYEVRVRRESSGNFDIGFSEDCSARQDTTEVRPDADDPNYYTEYVTARLYGCAADGGTVVVELLKNNSVLLTIEQDITVVDNRVVPTPTTPPTPTPHTSAHTA